MTVALKERWPLVTVVPYKRDGLGDSGLIREMAFGDSGLK